MKKTYFQTNIDLPKRNLRSEASLRASYFVSIIHACDTMSNCNAVIISEKLLSFG